MLAFIIILISAEISGLVHSDTEEPLPDVSVVIIGSNLGTGTDSTGKCLIENIPLGRYLVEASMIGYRPETITVNIEENRTYYANFKLKPMIIEMDGIVVTEKLYPTVRSISSTQISDHPESFFIQRVLASSPGIGTMEDYSAQICVRGGDPDENLTIIDEIEFPYPTHFGRFGGDGGAIMIVPNVFIDKVNFYPGGFPAEYGNKLSSVIDIKLKKEEKDFIPYLDVNLADMTYAISCPYCFISYRNSHLGVINKIQKLIENQVSFPKYEDIFCKAVFYLGERNKFWLLGNKADDELYFKGEYDVSKYGVYLKDIEFRQNENQNTVGLVWQCLFSKDVMFLTSLSRNSIQWNIYQKGIGKVDANIYSAPCKFALKHKYIESGLSYKYLRFYHYLTLFPDTTPTNIVIPGDTVQGADESYYLSGYFNGNFSVFKNLSIIPGIRMDYFELIDKNVINPRIAINYKLTNLTDINFASGKFSQMPRYDYLVINKNLDYENAYHFVFGIAHFLNDKTKISIEAYTKFYNNLISIPTDSSDYFYIKKELDNSQQGYARGIELNFEKPFFGKYSIF